jgi:hypothetical protein
MTNRECRSAIEDFCEFDSSGEEDNSNLVDGDAGLNDRIVLPNPGVSEGRIVAECKYMSLIEIMLSIYLKRVSLA